MVLLLLLLLLLRRADNIFFLQLRILFDSLGMSFWVKRVLGVCATSGFNPISLHIILFGIVSNIIFLRISNLFKLSLNHMKMLNKTFNIIKSSSLNIKQAFYSKGIIMQLTLNPLIKVTLLHNKIMKLI